MGQDGRHVAIDGFQILKKAVRLRAAKLDCRAVASDECSKSHPDTPPLGIGRAVESVAVYGNACRQQHLIDEICAWAGIEKGGIAAE